MPTTALKPFSWERMSAAVEDVRDRAFRATAALSRAGIAHVRIGGHAVAASVAWVDKETIESPGLLPPSQLWFEGRISMSSTLLENVRTEVDSYFGSLRLTMAPAVQRTQEQFFELCQQNRKLRLERTANGQLTFLPPVGGESSAQTNPFRRSNITGPGVMAPAKPLIPVADSFFPTAPIVPRRIMGSARTIEGGHQGTKEEFSPPLSGFCRRDIVSER